MTIYTKEEQFKLIENDPLNLAIIDNQYNDVCLEAIKNDEEALQYVKEQTEEMCLEAVKRGGWSLQYVKEQTPQVCLEAVKKFGLALQYVKEQTPEICLEAIKKHAWAIMFVEEQTEKMCLEAVKQNGLALEFVKEQTEEMCLLAVKNNGESLGFVKEQTEEMCLLAIKNSYNAIKKVRNKTPIVCFYTFLQYSDLLRLKYIKNGLEKFIKNSDAIENKVFCIDKYKNRDRDFYYFNIKSLLYIKDFLIKENVNNTYIVEDVSTNNEDFLELLKELTLSNNKLVIIDTGNIKSIHKKLANKIMSIDELEKGSL